VAQVLEKRVKDFLEIENIDDEPTLTHAARKRDYSTCSPAQWAWLFRVKQIARHVAIPDYSASALSAAQDMSYSTTTINYSWTVVPEPSTYLLLAVGLAALLLVRRKRQLAWVQ